MTLVGPGLLLALCGAGVAGLVPLGRSPRTRSLVSGTLTCMVGLGGLAAGTGALLGESWSASSTHLLPLSRGELAVDSLSGIFMFLVGAVTLATGVYSIGYPQTAERPDHTAATHGVSSRTAQAALPMFAAAMVFVPAAGNVTTFLFLWELMALLSLTLVLTEHRTRPAVGQAGIWYAAMAHAGLVAILVALVILSTGVGAESFAEIRELAPALSSGTQSLVFMLAFIGFGSKAGLVPLHVWLPRAHPEAPSYVSALMSAAMVNLGVYGVLRVGFDLLGGGPRWWWLLVLVVGALSALYGVLQAMAATDLKRLLAYSTTENLGLIFLGIGAAGTFAATGQRGLAGLLMLAAVLHTVNHAAFKTLLFLGAGAVLRSTHLRDLDATGGLARRMPFTTVLVGIGALGASGLPPGNGFVSEWLLLQGLIHSLPVTGSPDVALAVVMPVAVGIVALTVGLGVATFVKAFGVGFLARSRSPEAAAAVEVPGTMRVGMALAALACGLLALAPFMMVSALESVLGVMPSIGDDTPVRGEVELRLSGITGSMSPLLIALGLVGGAVLATIAVRGLGSRHSRRTTLVWGSGGTRLSPRMEYTATAYAEPLIRVFDDVLRPEHDIEITHYQDSRYLVESIGYRQRVSDRIEIRLYLPLIAAANRWADLARRLQNGSVHRYLALGLAGLLIVLVVVGLTS